MVRTIKTINIHKIHKINNTAKQINNIINNTKKIFKPQPKITTKFNLSNKTNFSTINKFLLMIQFRIFKIQLKINRISMKKIIYKIR